MLIKRVITSIFLIISVAVTLSIDWLTGLVVTVFVFLGLREFFDMLEGKGINIYRYFGIGLGILIPLSLVFRFELTRAWECLFLVLALLVLILLQFKRRQSTGVIVDISTTIFGIIYISWLLSFLIRIRYLSGGMGLFLTVLLITKLGDIGAYFVGMRLGKTPLIPRISPKKTIEGAIGGLVFSIIGAFISKPFLNLSYLHLLFIGVSLGILGQLGDLSESLMKRDCQVKDSGAILPGMGGALALVDSLLFTAPAFYVYLNIMLN